MSLLAPAMTDPAAQKQVRDVLTKIGRAHAPGFLSDEAAVTLLENLVAADWWLAFKDGEAVVEANLKEFEALDVAARANVLKNVNAQAARSFQYLFEKVRISEKVEKWETPEGALGDFFTALNSASALEHFRAITGDRRIAYVDAMATRYRSGHFLTLHHDEHGSNQRLYAYVISLTPAWKPEWGGLLTFVSRDGHVAEAYTPSWNALNIFKVPQAHAVSVVAPFAAGGRYAITGWLRADKP